MGLNTILPHLRGVSESATWEIFVAGCCAWAGCAVAIRTLVISKHKIAFVMNLSPAFSLISDDRLTDYPVCSY